MSLTKNQKLSFWKEVESSIRSISPRMGKYVLTSDDSARVANAYVLWALVIQDLLGDARTCSDRNLASWVRKLMNIDVEYLQDTCKQLLTSIRTWSPYMGTGLSRDDFKHHLVVNGVTPGDACLAPLWSAIYRFSETFEGFKTINSCLNFIGRLTLNDVSWIEKTAIAKYVQFERDIKCQRYDRDILAQLRELYLIRIKRYHFDGFRPSHGNGATSDTVKGVGTDMKFQKFQHSFGTHQIDLMTGWSHPLITSEPISGNSLHARVSFVPKGINKKRVISTEPISHQYYQHLIAGSIDAMFQRDREWGVDLHDQTHNQKLALRGSGHGKYATIDLSDASDSVTRTLVEAIMHGTPLYSLMERCRSRWGILPNRQVIRFEKYAPMGSAVCFPLQCMIYSLIIQLASKNCGVHTYFRVYGDDLVVPDCIFDEVIRLLEELHFTVNHDKTFPPYSVFTESCGIECYNGCDVSPLRIPRFYDSLYHKTLDTSPGRVFGVISLANRLYEFGCFNARSYVIHRLLEFVPDVPFSVDPEIGLFSPNATNFHLKKRWNRDLQREEYLCYTLCTEVDEVVEDRMYIHTLEKYDTTTRLGLLDPSDLVQVRVGSSHLRPKRRWRSAWDLSSQTIDPIVR